MLNKFGYLNAKDSSNLKVTVEKIIVNFKLPDNLIH